MSSGEGIGHLHKWLQFFCTDIGYEKSNIMIKGIWGNYRSWVDLIAAKRKFAILGDNRNVLQGTQICLRSSQKWFIRRLQYRVDLMVCAAWELLQNYAVVVGICLVLHQWDVLGRMHVAYYTWVGAIYVFSLVFLRISSISSHSQQVKFVIYMESFARSPYLCMLIGNIS